MTRPQLEHILRAAGAIAQEEKLVVIGSQSILGAYPEAPPQLNVSLEVDLYPLEFVSTMLSTHLLERKQIEALIPELTEEQRLLLQSRLT